MSKQSISGLILAGGRGTRMAGHDKGLLPLAGQPMILSVIERLKTQVNTLFISANRHVSSYQQWGYEVLCDDFDDFRGPLAGIAQGLRHCQTEYLLTVPCDGPCLPRDLGVRMYRLAQQEQLPAIMVSDGQYRQAAYNLLHKSLLPAIQLALDNKHYKLAQWLSEQGAAIADFSDQAPAFININSLEDLHLLDQQLSDQQA